LPGAGLPALYLISGRALDVRGQKPYRAVFDTMNSGTGPIALAAIEGAGPLDYQDYPIMYPVISFLQPGLKDVKISENPVNDTAGIIGNFTTYLLEQNLKMRNVPARSGISGSLYLQSRGLPGFDLQP
jgi:hypothetical protein